MKNLLRKFSFLIENFIFLELLNLNKQYKYNERSILYHAFQFKHSISVFQKLFPIYNIGNLSVHYLRDEKCPVLIVLKV